MCPPDKCHNLQILIQLSSETIKQLSDQLRETFMFAHKINHMYSKWWLDATAAPVQNPAQKTANLISPTVLGCKPESAPSLAYLCLWLQIWTITGLYVFTENM